VLLAVLVLLDLLVSLVLLVQLVLRARTVLVVFVVTPVPLGHLESRAWLAQLVLLEIRDLPERAALLVLLVPPDLRVSLDPVDSLVCLDLEETVVFLAVLVPPERLVELDLLVPQDPVVPLETSACPA